MIDPSLAEALKKQWGGLEELLMIEHFDHDLENIDTRLGRSGAGAR
jgi:hypothetical protein